jgi:hypothetical protein
MPNPSPVDVVHVWQEAVALEQAGLTKDDEVNFIEA